VLVLEEIEDDGNWIVVLGDLDYFVSLIFSDCCKKARLFFNARKGRKGRKGLSLKLIGFTLSGLARSVR